MDGRPVTVAVSNQYSDCTYAITEEAAPENSVGAVEAGLVGPPCIKNVKFL